jgi:hypothetical protein
MKLPPDVPNGKDRFDDPIGNAAVWLRILTVLECCLPETIYNRVYLGFRSSAMLKGLCTIENRAE